MKEIAFCLGIFITSLPVSKIQYAGCAQFNPGFIKDSLPNVLTENRGDIVGSMLKNEAFLRFAEHQLPKTKTEWEKYRSHLREEIINKTGVTINHQLPLNYQETGSLKMDGYSIKKIIFQTRPDVYATANLYIPDGNGPFPAVINMNGHWREARMAEPVQSVGHTLALNGFVCLNIDAFGAGERSAVHGEYDYHGGNLGASLMNVGESLMGFQISDNIRGVDLLCSLSYVDAKHIGATGASGGGNQTMWVTAMDERIKAAVPVVSIGTFESYVMADNCICELLIDGLTYTEESGILALIAPRAIKMCNHRMDDIPPFLPPQMLRTFNNARPVFKMLGVENNIAYDLFDLTHGYWPEDRQVMLGWFNLHLKGIGDGSPVKEIPFKTLSDQQLMVFAKGQRDPKVITLADYCRRKGEKLRADLVGARSFNADQKRKQLRSILRIPDQTSIKNVFYYSKEDDWERIVVETTNGKLIPLLHLAPHDPLSGYVIICNPKGKKAIATDLIENFKKKGSGIIVLDLSGSGEASSPRADTLDGSNSFHTLSRANLWMGKTILGEWVNELNVTTQFLKSRYKAKKIEIDGSKEAGLSALFLVALGGNIDSITLREAPVSYLFDKGGSINFFSMAIHLPGFLNWGDVSLAAALSGKNIRFIDPVTMSGQKITQSNLKEYENEFERVRKFCNRGGKTFFN